MRIGFITTINTNIGDDFIRTGIEHILDSVKGDKELNYTYVNKHFPETAITPNSPIHILNKLPRFKGKQRLYNLYYKHLHSYFNVYKDQDLIIQSGAPVLWPNCQDNEWAAPIWYNIVGKLKNKIPALNLAAGSCYPWENQSGFTNRKEAGYAKDIGGFCKLTTTRDKLANTLFNEVNVQNVLMPCTAFFVTNKFENQHKGEYILINYMHGGGHFDWDQHVDANEWENTMKTLVSELSANHEVRFICHNDKEVEEARKTFPGKHIYYPKTVAEYMRCIERAKLGINNRMHASVAMASVGVPAISICTDTRLLMLDNIGLPVHYVKNVTPQQLLIESGNLLKNADAERSRLFELKKSAFSEYGNLLKPFLEKN